MCKKDTLLYKSDKTATTTTGEASKSLRLKTFGRMSARMSDQKKEEVDESVKKYALIDMAILRDKTVVLEIGSGDGSMMIERAKKAQLNKDTAVFICTEVYKPAIKAMIENADKNKLTNFFIFDKDARDLLEILPNNILDEVLITYPDPWPKARHQKRRIVSLDILTIIAEKFKKTISKKAGKNGEDIVNSGSLWLICDVPNYVSHMLGEIFKSTFEPVAKSPLDWVKPPVFWSPTKYELKAKKQGRSTWYMEFKDKHDLVDYHKCERL